MPCGAARPRALRAEFMFICTRSHHRDFECRRTEVSVSVGILCAAAVRGCHNRVRRRGAAGLCRAAAMPRVLGAPRAAGAAGASGERAPSPARRMRSGAGGAAVGPRPAVLTRGARRPVAAALATTESEPPEDARGEARASGGAKKALASLALLIVGSAVVVALPGASPQVNVLCSAALGGVMAYGGLKKKSLNWSGALAAVMVGAVSLAANAVFGSVLLAFFISSSALTKYGNERKARIEDGHKAGGQRDWVQVAANGGLPTAFAGAHIALRGLSAPVFDAAADPVSTALACAYLCYYSCCAGDTWSSELGVLSKAEPILITTLRRCKRGTNGGVSPLGTGAALGGGLVCGAAAVGFGTLAAAPASGAVWAALPLCVGAGLFGSMVDSLLGATLQFSGFDPVKGKVVNKPGPGVTRISGLNFLDNHAVNFVSALITSAAGAAVGLWLM